MIQFHIITQASEVENLCTQLRLLGATAISLKDAATQPLYEPLPGEDIVWQKTAIIALFKDVAIQTPLSLFLENEKNEAAILGETILSFN